MGISNVLINSKNPTMKAFQSGIGAAAFMEAKFLKELLINDSIVLPETRSDFLRQVGKESRS